MQYVLRVRGNFLSNVYLCQYTILLERAKYRLDVESRDLRDFKAEGPGL